MRTWRKTLGLLAGGLVGLGGLMSTAAAQYPIPGGAPPYVGMPPNAGMPPLSPMPPMGPNMAMPPGGMGMPPGGAMPPMAPNMGMPPGGMGMPPGGGMGMPPGGMGPGAFAGMPPGGGMGPGAFAGAPPAPPAEFPNNAAPTQEQATPFSIKDEGMPNAFSCLVDPRTERPLCFQISLDYSIIWFRGGNYPPLATTGSLNDQFPGALGQPNTRVISGGQRFPGPSSAFRTSMTYWLIDPECFSLEGSFLIMEQRSVPNAFQSDENGFPVLARPFFDPTIGNQNADPRSLPGILQGTLYDTVTTRVMGADVNVRWHGSPGEGANFSWLVGARWFSLDERYRSSDTTRDLAPGGLFTTISDDFATYNQFFGGQVGAEYQYKAGRLLFSFGGKVAIGPNYQTLRISGQTVQTDPVAGTTVTDISRGLFAQASNSGVYNTIKIAVLPEMTAKMNIDLTDHVRFHVGYTFLLLSSTTRPGDQMDRTINIQPLLIGNGLVPLSPGPAVFRKTTFSANMLDVGLEFCF